MYVSNPRHKIAVIAPTSFVARPTDHGSLAVRTSNTANVGSCGPLALHKLAYWQAVPLTANEEGSALVTLFQVAVKPTPL